MGQIGTKLDIYGTFEDNFSIILACWDTAKFLDLSNLVIIWPTFGTNLISMSVTRNQRRGYDYTGLEIVDQVTRLDEIWNTALKRSELMRLNRGREVIIKALTGRQTDRQTDRQTGFSWDSARSIRQQGCHIVYKLGQIGQICDFLRSIGQKKNLALREKNVVTY